MPITLRQIAEKAGCSRALVSFALNGGQNVSAESRARILAIATELGWAPNAALARHMALTRATTLASVSNNLAVLLDKRPEELALEYPPRMFLAGACARGKQLGCTVDVFNLARERMTAQRLRTVLHARGIEGLVFIITVGRLLARPFLDLGLEFAASAVGVRDDEPGFHTSITDFHANGVTALHALRTAGYERPVAVLPRGVDRPLGWSFAGGLLAGQLEWYPERPLPVLFTGTTENHIPRPAWARVAQFLVEHKADSVLTTDSAHMAEIIGDHAALRGRASLFSLNWSPGDPSDGGIDQRYDLIGGAAVDLIIGQLHRSETGRPAVQRTIQIPGAWVWKTPEKRRRAGTGQRRGRPATP